MPSFPKPPSAKKSRKDAFELREKLRQTPCVACGFKTSQPCHIKTFGSGGMTDHQNLIPMCHSHHTLQHQIGWVRMWETFSGVRQALIERGWKIHSVWGLKKLTR